MPVYKIHSVVSYGFHHSHFTRPHNLTTKYSASLARFSCGVQDKNYETWDNSCIHHWQWLGSRYSIALSQIANKYHTLLKKKFNISNICESVLSLIFSNTWFVLVVENLKSWNLIIWSQDLESQYANLLWRVWGVPRFPVAKLHYRHSDLIEQSGQPGICA